MEQVGQCPSSSQKDYNAEPQLGIDPKSVQSLTSRKYGGSALEQQALRLGDTRQTEFHKQPIWPGSFLFYDAEVCDSSGSRQGRAGEGCESIGCGR